jgi:hypothetical protein
LLIISIELKNYQKKIKDHLIDCLNEIDAYCAQNDWISDIKKYITKYSAKLVLEWKAIGSHEIEEQLNKIRNWIDQLKLGVEKTIITNNKVLKIDCKSIEETLVPKLEIIFNEICECIQSELNKDSGNFNDFMNKVIKEIDNRPKNIEVFSNYAKLVNKHRDNIPVYESRIANIKNFIDVARQNYTRNVNTVINEDDNNNIASDIQFQVIWKTFMSKIQEAIEYISIQSPHILDQLNNLYLKYSNELKQIHSIGTTGKFTDPFENSTQIIEELKTVNFILNYY